MLGILLVGLKQATDQSDMNTFSRHRMINTLPRCDYFVASVK